MSGAFSDAKADVSTSKISLSPKYRIQSNYRTYPYKCTVKEFRCLPITAILIAYVVSTHLNCINL